MESFLLIQERTELRLIGDKPFYVGMRFWIIDALVGVGPACRKFGSATQISLCIVRGAAQRREVYQSPGFRLSRLIWLNYGFRDEMIHLVCGRLLAIRVRFK